MVEIDADRRLVAVTRILDANTADRICRRRAGIDDRQVGYATNQIGRRLDIELCQILFGNSADRQRHLQNVLGTKFRGDDDLA